MKKDPPLRHSVKYRHSNFRANGSFSVPLALFSQIASFSCCVNHLHWSTLLGRAKKRPTARMTVAMPSRRNILIPSVHYHRALRRAAFRRLSNENDAVARSSTDHLQLRKPPTPSI